MFYNLWRIASKSTYISDVTFFYNGRGRRTYGVFQSERAESSVRDPSKYGLGKSGKVR